MKESSPPWGKWIVLEEGKNYKVKRIEVNKGERLSYQKHEKRSEHWFVVQGKAMVTIDGRDIEIMKGECVDIPKKSLHRIKNTAEETLIFIEIQIGDYLGEDDITRVEDDYGRGS